VIPTPEAKSVTVPSGCRFCSIGPDTNFMVGVELMIQIDLVPVTLLCEWIGGAVVFTFSVLISSADRLLWNSRRRRNPHPSG